MTAKSTTKITKISTPPHGIMPECGYYLEPSTTLGHYPYSPGKGGLAGL